MTQTNYYLDAYTDEVMPCASTLDAWAEWLSKPAPDWSRPDAAQDGETFACSTLIVLGDVRVEHDGTAWVAVEPVPDGATSFHRRHFQDSQGWDAQFSADTLENATDGIDADEGPLFYACTKDGPSYVATFRADGPRLDLELVQ